jgi:hypothetical protein
LVRGGEKEILAFVSKADTAPRPNREILVTSESVSTNSPLPN